jgi:hypothetical protein
MLCVASLAPKVHSVAEGEEGEEGEEAKKVQAEVEGVFLTG